MLRAACQPSSSAAALVSGKEYAASSFPNSARPCRVTAGSLGALSRCRSNVPPSMQGKGEILRLHATTSLSTSRPSSAWTSKSLKSPQRSLAASAEAASTPTLTATSDEGAVAPPVIEELSSYLERELPRLFTPEGMQSDGKFEDVVEFEDPITRYDSLAGYLFNISMLRALFSPVFQLHSVEQTGAAELTTRWTMKMYFRLLPWQPEIVFTGLSIYGINPASGKFKSHKDIWDSIKDNAYFSREGLMDLLDQCSKLYQPPENLGSPPFDVVLRRAKYEVRRYSPYSVVQTPWTHGASTVGSHDLGTEAASLQRWASSAGARLGQPLMWALGAPGEDQAVQLQRPLAGAGATPSAASEGGQVSVVQASAEFVAVASFSGAATAEEFAARESLLRASMAQDGLDTALPPGSFNAATYAGASLLTLPALQRNEVMLPLEGFTWP